MRAQPCSSRALTLIETLAAIALLALVASALGTGLGAASHDARLRRAASACLYADRTARFMAPIHGPMVINVRRDEAELAITAPGEENPLRVFELPAGVSIQFLDESGGAVEHASFDALGRASDYLVICTVGGSSVRYEVAGLTGWHTREVGDVKP